MKSEDKKLKENKEDPFQNWFLNRWMPIGIGGVGTLITITLAFISYWEIAAGVLIAGISFSLSSWLIQFYRRQIRNREKLLLQRGEQLEGTFTAALEAREAVVEDREKTIANMNVIIKQIKGSHEAVIDSMHSFIESTRIEGHKLGEKYKEFLKSKGKRKKEILYEARDLGHSFLLEALEGLINIFRPLTQTVEGGHVKLWAAFRQHNAHTKTYDTTARHGEYTKVREFSSESISENKDIPKLIRDTYNRDGVGIVILSPSHDSYDKKTNDKYQDNLSMIAGPIIIGHEMPMFIVLNSPNKDIFHDKLKPYMRCCTSYLSECIKSWSELVEIIK